MQVIDPYEFSSIRTMRLDLPDQEQLLADAVVHAVNSWRNRLAEKRGLHWSGMEINSILAYNTTNAIQRIQRFSTLLAGAKAKLIAKIQATRDAIFIVRFGVRSNHSDPEYVLFVDRKSAKISDVVMMSDG